MNEPISDFGFEREVQDDLIWWNRKTRGDYSGWVIQVEKNGWMSVRQATMLYDEACRFSKLLQLAIRVYHQLAAGVKVDEVEFK